MPVNQNEIKNAIITFIENANSSNDPEDLDAAIDSFADELATTIKDAILSATVTIPSGAVQVITNGSATTQSGSNPAPVSGEFLS